MGKLVPCLQAVVERHRALSAPMGSLLPSGNTPYARVSHLGGCCALIHFKYPVKESRFYNTAVRDLKCQGARSDCMYGHAFWLWPEDGSPWDDGSGQGFTL